MEEFVSTYGYFAIFVLTFFEGESVLIAAGFLAVSGYLDEILVIIVSAFASYVGHGAFFLIALYRRESLIKFVQRFLKVDLSKLEYLMVKYGIASIFISQWIYGFRLLSAAVLGLSGIGIKKYFFYLFISCVLWASICTYAGYFFGVTLKNLLGEIKAYNQYIALGVLLTGFIIWFIRDVQKRRNSANAKKF